MPSNNISIIGPRMSGKTTYLAALAYHESHGIQHNQKITYTVTPQTIEARNLKNKAKLLLEKQGQIEPTNIGKKIKTIEDLPFYSFAIERQISKFEKIFNNRSIPEKIQITTRDYPGEIFNDLAESNLSGDDKEAFVEDCFINKRGCIMMLPAWESGIDDYYLSMLENLVDMMDNMGNKKDYKMAVVMSKCERGEIWPGRLEPESDLFQLHLPETTKYLRRTFEKNVAFFALSTFGVRGAKDPRPNRIDLVRGKESGSILYQSGKGQWKPYNLIEPLYWLMKV